MKNRPPSFAAFSMTFAGLLLTVAGLTGYKINQNPRILDPASWEPFVIWWEVWMGLAFLAGSIYWWRRAIESWRRA
jgi:hypothetical protein